jgi:DNA-binding LacI/PurR family transcriptional regulator
MKDRVTIYEVARASGVSLATVSRVINKKGNVTEETRRRVEETIVRLGYKPSAVAQALATSKSTNIGIVIPSANYVYISNIVFFACILEECYCCTVCSSGTISMMSSTPQSNAVQIFSNTSVVT